MIIHRRQQAQQPAKPPGTPVFFSGLPDSTTGWCEENVDNKRPPDRQHHTELLPGMSPTRSGIGVLLVTVSGSEIHAVQHVFLVIDQTEISKYLC
jgi:hypothetical protein